MKKFVSLFISVIIAFSCVCAAFSGGASAAYDAETEGLDLKSECYLLVSMDNGEVIFEKDARKQVAPASLTKLITAIVVIENCKDLNATITISEECIDELSGTGSSLGGLKVGEVVTVHDMLCLLLIKSANEAATALADYINPDRTAFVNLMNSTAAKIGCKNTHFVNPHGLDDPDQYTSAEDIAAILEYGLQYAVFADIISHNTYTLAATNLQKERAIPNTNYLLNRAYEDYYSKYCKGGKTGTTEAAGRCVASYASNDGYNYICVAMGGEMKNYDDDDALENPAFIDSKALYEWTFKNIELVAVAEPSQMVGEVRVKYGKSTDYISLSPAETLYSLVPVGTKSGSLLIEPIEETLPDYVEAPIAEGQVICKGRVLYAGRVIKEIDLVASGEVKKGFFAFLGEKIGEIISTTAFKITVAVIVLLIAAALIIIKKRKNRIDRGYKATGYTNF